MATFPGAPPTAVNNSYDKPKKKEDWVSVVENRIKEGTNWIERRQMLVNLNYYVGNQWIVWDNTQRQVVTAPNPNNMERITHNVLAQRIMQKLSKQIKNRVQFDIMPDTSNEERIETAKAAKKFVDAWWDEQEMDRKTRDIFLSSDIKGWCAAKVIFDNQRGDNITPDNMEDQELYTGEVVVHIVDPLVLFVDPGATTDDEIRWIAEQKPKDIDYIKEKYGVTVGAEPNVSFMTNYDVSTTTSNGLTTGGIQRKTNNMALLNELWMAPCKEYPKGLKVTTAGGQMLDYDDEAGELPYVLFGEIPMPGSVKYRAALQDMLPIQRTINIAKTLMATHLKRMGNSMWAIPMGSDVDEEMLTNDEGGMFYYNGENGSPMRVAPNDLPSFFDRIIEYAIRDLDDMSGVREIAAGAMPAGLDTASGLALMVEQENEKLAVTSQNYERGMRRVLRRVLQLIKRHYTEERQAKILGDDSEIELVSFRGSDLSGAEDIHIIPGSSLPEMKSAQQDRIMTMWNSGAIVNAKTGAPDTKRFLRLMGMGDSQELFEQDLLDENTAKMENKKFQRLVEDPQLFQGAMMYQQMVTQIQQSNQQMTMEAQNRGLQPDAVQSMMQKPPPPPQFLPRFYDFQNHEIHIEQHNLFRKSEKYNKLPPEVQEMVNAHVAEHEQAIAQMAANIPPNPEIEVKKQANEIRAEQNQIKREENEMDAQIEREKIASEERQTELKTTVTMEDNERSRLHERVKHIETLTKESGNRGETGQPWNR